RSGAGFDLAGGFFHEADHGIADFVIGNRASEVAAHLAEYVFIAGFGKISLDHLFGVFRSLVPGLAELFGRPMPQFAVAAGHGPELLILIEDKFALEGVLAVVER